MQGIFLSRAEFLVLLDALDGSAVIGIPRERLFPPTREEHLRQVQEGIQSLTARGLLQTTPDGTHKIDPLLLAVAAVVVRPEVALISVRELPGQGRQLFLHYARGPYVAEQTFPEEGRHWLAALSDREALLDRLVAIFPLVGPTDPAGAATLSQEELVAARDAAAAGRRAEVAALLHRRGMVAPAAAACADAMADPTMSGTIALMRCADEGITDGRNPALIQGRQGAWSIAQSPAGAPVFRLTPVDAETFRAQLSTWLDELSGPTL